MKINHQKIIALTIGVLVFTGAINYSVFAWTEPTVGPPNNNISAPINASSFAQTKTGDLTVLSLTTNGASPQIDLLGGIIHKANYLIGHNDLQLYSDEADPASAKIDLGLAGSDKIKFHTNNQERMRIEGNGDIYIDGLSDCFLEVSGDGKMQCYTPPGPAINKTFTSVKSTIFEINRSSDGTNEDSHTVADDEAVTKITMNAVSVYKSRESSSCGFPAPYIKSYFYIKEAGGTEWGVARESLEFTPYCYVYYGFFDNYCRCVAGSKSGEWYYHLKQGDEIKITTQVFEGSVFGDIISNLNSSVLAENLTFNREITEYVSCEEGKDILYYLDANATGEMWKVRERYSPENPLLMTTTADGIPIGLIVQ